MLAVILKILSILGIILLVLLGILLFLLLVILFMPIVYRFDGEKTEEVLAADFKARWLFGLFRAGYAYPEPGRFIVKVLWFTIYDSGAEDASDKKQEGESAGSEEKQSGVNYALLENTNDTDSVDNNADTVQNVSTASAEAANTNSNTTQDSSTQNESESTPKTLWDKLLQKIEKIKYTFRKICGKIRHILDEYEFYRDLLEDEESKALFAHACKRIGKVLRHIRPRKLNADITFGTGSPDTTGYAYGIYGMFSPKLGEDICITPNFEEQILVGKVHAAGHITVFTLLINVIAVALDKRLHIFIRRLKAHKTSH